MKLGWVENIYTVFWASLFYFSGGASSGQTIVLGCFACLGFLPSYKVLVEGVKKGISFGFLIFNASIGGAFVFLMQVFLAEEKVIDMTVLFVSSYVAAKGFRLFIVGILVNKRMRK